MSRRGLLLIWLGLGCPLSSSFSVEFFSRFKVKFCQYAQWVNASSGSISAAVESVSPFVVIVLAPLWGTPQGQLRSAHMALGGVEALAQMLTGIFRADG